MHTSTSLEATLIRIPLRQWFISPPVLILSSLDNQQTAYLYVHYMTSWTTSCLVCLSHWCCTSTQTVKYIKQFVTENKSWKQQYRESVHRISLKERISWLLNWQIIMKVYYHIQCILYAYVLKMINKKTLGFKNVPFDTGHLLVILGKIVHITQGHNRALEVDVTHFRIM